MMHVVGKTPLWDFQGATSTKSEQLNHQSPPFVWFRTAGWVQYRRLGYVGKSDLARKEAHILEFCKSHNNRASTRFNVTGSCV